jgi:hypothetical protein
MITDFIFSPLFVAFRQPLLRHEDRHLLPFGEQYAAAGQAKELLAIGTATDTGGRTQAAVKMHVVWR